MEEWWVSPSKWREVHTENGKSSTHMYVDQKEYLSPDPLPMEAALVTLHEAIVHPVQFMSDGGTAGLKPVEPQEHPEKFGSLALSCVERARAISSEDTIPLGLFPTFCVSADNALRVTSDSGVLIVANLSGKFQDHNVAVKLTGSQNNVPLFEAKIDSLRSMEDTPADWWTEGLEIYKGGAVRIGSGVMLGQRLSTVPPQYPASARAHHVSGAVLLRAIIGEDGHIRELEPVSFPSADLALESVRAVSQWTYKPYILNFKRTEVETSIVVNFNVY
ncbi:MAG: energy transducer TonB [Acidobacteriaceae bacterium]|nr:energy transducer TonB [Acidobacteriaceae bacterium]